jgi:hypothetical protein
MGPPFRREVGSDYWSLPLYWGVILLVLTHSLIRKPPILQSIQLSIYRLRVFVILNIDETCIQHLQPQ